MNKIRKEEWKQNAILEEARKLLSYEDVVSGKIPHLFEFAKRAAVGPYVYQKKVRIKPSRRRVPSWKK